MNVEAMPGPSESTEGEPRQYRIYEGGLMGGPKITIEEVESTKHPKEVLIEFMTRPDSNVRGIINIEGADGEEVELSDDDWDEVAQALEEHQRRMYEQSQG